MFSWGADKPLYVILILVIMITLLSAALLIFYKKMKAIKPKGESVAQWETSVFYHFRATLQINLRVNLN